MVVAVEVEVAEVAQVAEVAEVENTAPRRSLLCFHQQLCLLCSSLTLPLLSRCPGL
jgi:hypothetical protein